MQHKKLPENKALPFVKWFLWCILCRYFGAAYAYLVSYLACLGEICPFLSFRGSCLSKNKRRFHGLKNIQISSQIISFKLKYPDKIKNGEQ